MDYMNNNNAEAKRKTLSLIDITAIGINAVIGSGIFLLPGILFAQSGPACVLAYLIAGVICFIVALCFAEVSSIFRHSGGAYIYAREAFRLVHRVSCGVDVVAGARCNLGGGRGGVYEVSGLFLARLRQRHNREINYFFPYDRVNDSKLLRG